MKSHEFPALEQTLGGYLHQDFLLDYASAEEAIMDMVSSGQIEVLDAVRREIGVLIRRVETSTKPIELLLDVGCYYDPRADGTPIAEWLRKLERLILGQS